MNELIFFLQIISMIGFAWGALKLGGVALTTWVTVQALIANLFVLKQITLFGFEVTASDSFAIGSLMGLNLLQEYYGSKEAQKATYVCFLFLLFFTLFAQLHLLYQPNSHDLSQPSYAFLLSPSPRLFIASLFSFFVVQQFDITLFSFLKNKLPNVSFAVRAAISLVCSQFLDTLIFSVTGLYGIVASIFDIILVSFMIKLITITSFTTLLRFAKR